MRWPVAFVVSSTITYYYYYMGLDGVEYVGIFRGGRTGVETVLFLSHPVSFFFFFFFFSLFSFLSNVYIFYIHNDITEE